MILLVFGASLAVIIAINIFLWKSGFLRDAERPTPVIDKPVSDARARAAALKRVARWREEGKLSREEADDWERLCESDWG